LLHPADDRAVYVEFAAIYLELRHFEPDLLPCYFPAIEDPSRIDSLLAEDIPVDDLLARCRPEGAALTLSLSEQPAAEEVPAPGGEASPLPEEAGRALLDKGRAAAERGNLVRSAILMGRACQTTGT